MKRTSVGFEDDRFTQLEVIARVDGRSLSDVVREAVDEFVEDRLGREDFIEKAQGLVAQVEAVVRAARQADSR